MIFFSDMDGTFLDSHKNIPDACWEALDAIASADAEFVPCTGRPTCGIPADLLAHPSVHYAISSNGAAVLELCPDKPSDIDQATMLHAQDLSRKKARDIWNIAKNYAVTFDVFADGHCYTRRDFFDSLPEFIADPDVLQSMVDSRTPVDENPLQTIERVQSLERVAMYWKNPADRDAILKELEAIPNIEITRSYDVNIEVMEQGCSKGSAMEWLCLHLGIPLHDAVAFGDNMNDVSMLEAAGVGVAVANAEAVVRAAANLVCPSNDKAGAARVIMQQLHC